MTEYVAQLVASAPPPTADQLQILRGLLGPEIQRQTKQERRDAA